MSIRASLARRIRHERAPTLKSAEAVYASGRHADAAALFRVLAEQAGSEPAQLRLGQLYLSGTGVLQNFVEAARWFRTAADLGSVAAMARLGEIYLTGLAAPETAAPAALLHRLYPAGLSVAQDLGLAAKWNNLAAQADDAAAQARFGRQLARGLGVPRDLIEAERCAARGNSTAQLCLGLLLLFGEGIAHDPVRAASLLDQSARAGQPAAMFHLGELHRRGRGVAPSASAAESWLRRAASRGYVKAWLSLVQLFRAGPDPDLNSAAVLCRQAARGTGVEASVPEARRWLGAAALQGHAPAMVLLGGVLLQHVDAALDADADRAQAADLFESAAAQGNPDAQYSLGVCDRLGLGVARDDAAGHPTAVLALAQLQEEGRLQLRSG